ncbi:NUDIX domain-containing protein [Patescibacteria group bacterium]|nr:NUDIX domain-containing protein [Patescibacteria group bacterium]MBU0963942.1 NUDIX domain-containing protein [Patescibacteria group bacterium]
MVDERSAGAIIYCQQDNKIEYLLLQYPQGHWDFARGHIEPGETEHDAASREISEETGIPGLEFVPGFRELNNWTYRLPGGKISNKQAVYFIATCKNKSIIISEEHRKFEWLNYTQTLERITFSNTKEILAKAHNFIISSGEKV